MQQPKTRANRNFCRECMSGDMNCQDTVGHAFFCGDFKAVTLPRIALSDVLNYHCLFKIRNSISLPFSCRISWYHSLLFGCHKAYVAMRGSFLVLRIVPFGLHCHYKHLRLGSSIQHRYLMAQYGCARVSWHVLKTWLYFSCPECLVSIGAWRVFEASFYMLPISALENLSSTQTKNTVLIRLKSSEYFTPGFRLRCCVITRAPSSRITVKLGTLCLNHRTHPLPYESFSRFSLLCNESNLLRSRAY